MIWDEVFVRFRSSRFQGSGGRLCDGLSRCLRQCGRVADRAVQILGGSGYMTEFGIERFYRDVRLFRLYEGTTQIQQLIIAKNMIREARANA